VETKGYVCRAFIGAVDTTFVSHSVKVCPKHGSVEVIHDGNGIVRYNDKFDRIPTDRCVGVETMHEHGEIRNNGSS
jgi:hypothetical protein